MKALLHTRPQGRLPRFYISVLANGCKAERLLGYDEQSREVDAVELSVALHKVAHELDQIIAGRMYQT